MNNVANREIAKWAVQIVKNFERGSEFLGSRDPAEHVEYAMEEFPCAKLRVSYDEAFREMLSAVKLALA